jgi:hypothetical protein
VQDYEDPGDIPNVTDGGDNIGDDPEFVDPPDDYRLDGTSPCVDTGCGTDVPVDSFDVNDNENSGEPLPWDLDTNPRVLLGAGETVTAVDMGPYEFAGTGCRADCQLDANETVGINDFLALLGDWNQQCVPCDFGLGPAGVGTEDFLYLLGNWGSCPDYTGSPPDSIEDAVTDAGLDYPSDWDEFVDVMTDSEESQATKDNYRCWMDHYLDCHRRPFCIDCACQICPDDDPYDGH